ncbi:MAG: hypothetical protein KGZ81_04355 [Flavobacteriales bacterium]|nr:hypothetical protein [Flavobacteriales bacterium]
MKKKALFTLIALIVCVYLLGIGYIRNIKKNNDSIGLPSLSVYRNLTESERTIIIEKTDAIPMDDVVKYFEKKIVDYDNNKELINIISLDIYKDNLLMYEDQNQKQFNNLFINAEFSINTKDMTREEAENITHKMNSEIFDLCFKQDTYGFLKLNTFNINFIDNKKRSKYGYVNTNTIVSAIKNINQTKEELETQSIIYNFVHEHEKFLLRRFGVIDKTKELYIEIPIYDIYNAEDQINILEKLNSISDALFNKMGSNTLSKQYIENNNVNTITISFYVPWHKDKHITYNYKSED